MRIIRFRYKNNDYNGLLENKHKVIFLDDDLSSTSKTISFDKGKLIAPVKPSKIILIGLNYKDHAKELNMPIPENPIIFLKPLSTIIGHKDFIIYPSQVNRLDYEAELALVIKKRAKDIKTKEIKKYILGYTCLNDVTARDLQKKDGQWTRAKSFDTFCPLGPWIETDIQDPNNLTLRLYLNDELRQSSNTNNFIFPIDYIVSFISKIMTLYPGDIISTGTPPGVGSMKIGDKVTVEIEKIGQLTNFIK